MNKKIIGIMIALMLAAVIIPVANANAMSRDELMQKITDIKTRILNLKKQLYSITNYQGNQSATTEAIYSETGSKASGSSCSMGSECVTGICTNSVCVEAKANGQSCSTNGECSSNYCYGKVCTAVIDCATACQSRGFSNGTCESQNTSKIGGYTFYNWYCSANEVMLSYGGYGGACGSGKGCCCSGSGDTTGLCGQAGAKINRTLSRGEIADCCPGYTKVADPFSYSLGYCILTQNPNFVCLKLKDGICGAGENECNSPDDCPSRNVARKCIAGENQCLIRDYLEGYLIVNEYQQWAGPNSCCAGYYCKSDGCLTNTGTCKPKAVQCVAGTVNACMVCKSDGTGWYADNSKCAAGQICANGSCQSSSGDITAPTASKENTTNCAVNSECKSGHCSNGICCGTGTCGYGDNTATYPNTCLAEGETRSNPWGDIVCRSGISKIVLNGKGCDSPSLGTGGVGFTCDSGTCQSNYCISSTSTTNAQTTSTTKLANTNACTADSQCTSSHCSNGICCSSSQCGYGDGSSTYPRICMISGTKRSNPWGDVVCRSGASKIQYGGKGCSSIGFACDSGTCVSDYCQ